jgi:hypothetical protein
MRHRDHDVLTDGDILMQRRIGFIERGVAGFDRQPAMGLHGVARIDRHVEQRVLELGDVDERIP